MNPNVPSYDPTGGGGGGAAPQGVGMMGDYYGDPNQQQQEYAYDPQMQQMPPQQAVDAGGGYVAYEQQQMQMQMQQAPPSPTYQQQQGGGYFDVGGGQDQADGGGGGLYGVAADEYYYNQQQAAPQSPQQARQYGDVPGGAEMWDPSSPVVAAAESPLVGRGGSGVDSGAAGGGTYYPLAKYQPHVQSAPISAVAFDPTAASLFAASHTVSLGRRPHMGGGPAITHGAFVAVHGVPDGTIYSANSSHPEAPLSILEGISASIYGSPAAAGGGGAGGGGGAAARRKVPSRPPPHAYRPPYSSSAVDDPLSGGLSLPGDPFGGGGGAAGGGSGPTRKSHGMGIGSVLPFSSGVGTDEGFAVTVSPASVRVQTRGGMCVSSTRSDDVLGMTCGTLNPSANYDGSGVLCPTHVTVGGIASGGDGGGNGRYHMHCMDLYAGLRIVSSHTLAAAGADSSVSGSGGGGLRLGGTCVTALRPNESTSTLVAGCSDGTLRIFDGKWRKRGSKEVAKARGHAGGVVSVDVSDDGHMICTAGYSARSSFSSSASGATVPFAFPDQHVLIYDVRMLGRGGIVHPFSGERGGARYVSFVPGDDKGRVLVASGQAGGGVQIVTPWDDLEGTAWAEYFQPDLGQGERITALAVSGRDMAIGTSQSNVLLYKMSEEAAISSVRATSLPDAAEREPVVAPSYVPAPAEVSIEPNVLRIGAEDSTLSVFNAYMLQVKPSLSSLGGGDGVVKPFGPLLENVLVTSSRRLLSSKLMDTISKQDASDFVVSVKSSDLDLDLLTAEERQKKSKYDKRNSSEKEKVNIPNPNRLLFSNKAGAVCYNVDADPRKKNQRGGGQRGRSDDSNDGEESVPARYRLTVRPPSSIMTASDYVRHNDTGLWPGWDYPPSMPNSWASPILLLLYFVPEIRSAVLGAQSDKRLFGPMPATSGKKGSPKVTEVGPSVSCELGFLFHQIERLSAHALTYPILEGRPDEPQVRAFVPSNFLTTLATLPEASALQILDGAAVAVEAARRPEAFYRFLVHHLDNELPTTTVGDSGGGKTASKLIDSMQGLNFVSVNEFVNVSAPPTVSSTRTLTVDLSYEPFTGNGEEASSSPRFGDVLRHTLCKESRLRAWCQASRSYETVVQRKIATSLPKVLSISCACAGIKGNEGLPLWRGKGDSSSGPWLPEIIEVELENDGNIVVRELVDCEGKDGDEWAVIKGKKSIPTEVANTLRKSAEQWKATTSGAKKIRYKLDVVVSLVRSEFETEDDSSAGHHVLHVRIPDKYEKTALARQIYEAEKMSESTEATAGSPRPITLTANVSSDTFRERATNAKKKLEQANDKRDPWLLVNGLVVSKTVVEDARAFHVPFKEPCLVIFRQVDEEDSNATLESPSENIPLSIMNTPSLSTGLPPSFFVQSSSDLPGKGDLIAFDAEFVSVQHEESSLTATGSKVTAREGRYALARMSIIDCRTGKVIIDDHVLPREPVLDYLTRFSGLREGDLDLNSPHHLVTMRNAYLKLRLLLERGCIFVGHGLSQDFSTVNMFVPPSQVIDTVEVFHQDKMRYISLRFLVNYLLKRDMQQDIHDSIEDAKAAYDLYVKALEFKQRGEFEKLLREIYDYGRKVDWKVGVEERQNEAF